MELFQDYTVGNTYDKWKTGAILTQTEFDGTSLVFVYGVPAPTQVETHAFLLGDLMMSFAAVDDLPFVLLNIDNCGWMDAPFEPHCYPDGCFDHTFGAGEALPVIFFLVDTRYGKLLQIRACGFSTAFSNGFLEECRRIRALPWAAWRSTSGRSRRRIVDIRPVEICWPPPGRSGRLASLRVSDTTLRASAGSRCSIENLNISP